MFWRDPVHNLSPRQTQQIAHHLVYEVVVADLQVVFLLRELGLPLLDRLRPVFEFFGHVEHLLLHVDNVKAG